MPQKSKRKQQVSRLPHVKAARRVQEAEKAVQGKQAASAGGVDAATPLTTAVMECRRHGVGSVTNGSFISIRERFQSKLELLERGGPEAEKLRHEYRSCQGFCDPSLAVWLPNPGCHHWHHTSVPCEEAYRFPFHHNASAFLDRMGGFVHIEGHDKPVRVATCPSTLSLLDSKSVTHTSDQSFQTCLSLTAITVQITVGRMEGGRIFGRVSHRMHASNHRCDVKTFLRQCQISVFFFQAVYIQAV